VTGSRNYLKAVIVLAACVSTVVLFFRESSVRRRLSPAAACVPEFAAGLVTVLLPQYFH